MPLKVSLLAATPDAVKVVATAAHRCVSLDDPASFLLRLDRARAERIIGKAIGMGHDSILEHASFTFSIDGVSRSLSHQLVRFRIASFSQASQRYIEFKDGFKYVTPPSIAANPALHGRYDALMRDICDFYLDAVEAGIPAEDARFPVPNACETGLIMTMNARELHHMFRLRCCTHAQWEIREAANQILEIVQTWTPALFKNAGPSCVSTGRCPEGARGCGRRA